MKIEFKNFRCYEDKTFTFSLKGLCLLSGNSGKGKSTILFGIYFALFGKGTKVITYGKKNCSVKLEFNDLKIERTKGPNRLVVNDIYEDDAGQTVINETFGNTFDTTGYISQNSLNSFILLRPVEKLEFLEKFAFKNINLKQIKERSKKIISQKNKILIETKAKLELTENIFKELEKPTKIKFPIKTKDKDTEKIIEKQNIKIKNRENIIKKNIKNIKKLNINSSEKKIFDNNIKNIEENLNKEIEKLKEIEHEKISYIGDLELNSKKEELKKFIENKKRIIIQKQLDKDEKQLTIMKNNEKEDRENKLENINKTIWKDYPKEEVKQTIEDYNKCLVDKKQINKLKNKLNKLNKLEKYKEEKSLLEKSLISNNNIIDENKKILELIRLSNKIHKCPKCNTQLYFNNNKLEINSDKVNDNIQNKEKVLEIIKSTNNNNKYIKIKIKDTENVINNINNINSEILEIENCYEDITIMEDIEEDIKYFETYYNENIELEKQKNILNKQTYSGSLLTFEKNIKDKKKEISNLCDENLKDINEEELRLLINNEITNKNKIDSNNNNIKKISEYIELQKDKLKREKNEYNNKYKINLEQTEIIEKIKHLENENTKLQKEKQKYINNIEKIEKWKSNKKEYDNYIKWNDKLLKIKETEKEDRENYIASKIFKDKILQAESIAVTNIIDSINTHAQMYLDLFFIEDSINVNLLCFKKTKKHTKPQINLQIDYKGMECDINMLSGGELSRIILAFTLALAEMFNTPLIMLDECTSSLDADTSEIVFDAIKENFNNKLIIIIAHQVVKGHFDNTIEL